VLVELATVSVNDRPITSLRACSPARLSVEDPNSGEPVDLLCEVEEAGGSEYTRARFAHTMGPGVPFRVTVPEGHIFLASDDRHYHDDSRDFGTLPKEACPERIVFRLIGQRGWLDQSRRLSLIH
jgi:signal peptidase I